VENLPWEFLGNFPVLVAENPLITVIRRNQYRKSGQISITVQF
jgi:hypothetical protein